MRSWQPGGGARHLAYAADYAWLVDCFTRLGELTGRARWTERAVETADALLDLFHDDRGWRLLHHRPRRRSPHRADEGRHRRCHSFGQRGGRHGPGPVGRPHRDDRYSEAARQVVDLLGDLLGRHPTAFAQSVLTATHLLEGWIEVVVTGSRPDLVDVVQKQWLPGSVLAWGEPTSSPLWQDRDDSLRLRVPEPRLPAPGLRPRHPVRPAGRDGTMIDRQ